MGDRIDQQAVVAERVEDRRRVGGAGRRKRIDALFGAGEFVVEEFRQRVVDGVGARRGCAAEKEQDGDEARERHSVLSAIS